MGCYHRVVGARLVVLIAVVTLSTATASTPLQAPSTESGSPAAVEEAARFPAVSDIISLAVERARLQDEAGAELRFESIVSTTVDSLNGDGDVVEKQTTRHRRYPLEGSLYEELITRNGEPLSEADVRRETEQQKEFRRDAREAEASGERLETQDERQIRFNEDLMARFVASVLGEEIVAGERCWVIGFQPREGKLPAASRLDRALNQSSGRVYVTQTDYGVVRIDFELLRPVRYLWGMIASLRQATGRLEFERVEDTVWLPRAFDLHTEVRILFRTTRQHIVRQWLERDRVGALTNTGL